MASTMQMGQVGQSSMSTTNATTQQKSVKGASSFKTLGVSLALLAIISLCVAVADISLSVASVCELDDIQCPPKHAATRSDSRTMAVLMSYIASGIWGSIIVFLVGILAMRKQKDPDKPRTKFIAMAFLATFLILPTMMVISTVESYYLVGGRPKTVTSHSSTAIIIKFVTAVAGAVLALLEFGVLAAIVIKVCTSLSQPANPAKPEFPEPTDPLNDATFNPYDRIAGANGLFGPRPYNGNGPFAQPDYGYGRNAPLMPPVAQRAPPFPVRRNPASYMPSPGVAISARVSYGSRMVPAYARPASYGYSPY